VKTVVPSAGDPVPLEVTRLGVGYPALLIWLRHVG